MVNKRYQIVETIKTRDGQKRLVKAMTIYNSIDSANSELSKVRKANPTRNFEIRIV